MVSKAADTSEWCGIENYVPPVMAVLTLPLYQTWYNTCAFGITVYKDISIQNSITVLQIICVIFIIVSSNISWLHVAYFY